VADRLATNLYAKSQMPLRTIRLLVVEDSLSFQYLLREAFRTRDEIRWELTIAKDGEEALHILFEEENENVPLPDLILLDWNLPKISGSEVLQRIKLHHKLRRIPVLVFSSSEADEDIHTAYDNHANGYINKPLSAEALGAIVETMERFWIGVAQLPKVARGKTPTVAEK
jgi:chemotaxis family two-component system response regulator Rcp1